MPQPWNYGPTVFEWSDPGVTTAIVELDVPTRGTIQHLHYQELDGAGTAGTIKIYNSEAAALEAFNYNNGSSESSSSAALLPAPAAMSDITGGGYDYTDGALVKTDNDFSVHYRNIDGSYTTPVRRLWMVVEVTTGTPTDFSVAMVIDLPDMGS